MASLPEGVNVQLRMQSRHGAGVGRISVWAGLLALYGLAGRVEPADVRKQGRSRSGYG